MTDDEIAFLRARLDEDEAAANAAASVAGPDWHDDLFFEDNGGATTMILSASGSPLADTLHRDDEEMAPFIARHDPARALREIETLRSVVADCVKALRYPSNTPLASLARRNLASVAAIWSDHPDYRPESTHPTLEAS